MPTSVCVVWLLPPPHAAMLRKNTAAAANPGPRFPIEAPPALMLLYLNSLGIGRHLSSLPITCPAQPPPQQRIAGRHQPDHAAAGEHHHHDQDDAIRDRRPRVL